MPTKPRGSQSLDHWHSISYRCFPYPTRETSGIPRLSGVVLCSNLSLNSGAGKVVLAPAQSGIGLGRVLITTIG